MAVIWGARGCLAMTYCARSCSSPQGQDGNTGAVICHHPLLQMGAGDVGMGWGSICVISVRSELCTHRPICN